MCSCGVGVYNMLQLSPSLLLVAVQAGGLRQAVGIIFQKPWTKDLLGLSVHLSLARMSSAVSPREASNPGFHSVGTYLHWCGSVWLMTLATRLAT